MSNYFDHLLLLSLIMVTFHWNEWSLVMTCGMDRQSTSDKPMDRKPAFAG